jgi:2-polyprenyl-3-methyl-5-hydroxy-6-metoxy-1,4-benzoquinol methylase
MICPICRSNTNFYYNVNGYKSYQCINCNHIYVDTNSDFQESELYDVNFYENYMSGIGYHKAFIEQLLPDFKKKIAMIKEYLPVGSKILEVGCGPGYFGEMMQNEGYDSTGVELNEQCRNYAKEHGVHFDNFIIEDISKEDCSIFGKKYDAVISWATIEHVKDVNQYVALLKKYTKENGLIFIDTGITNKITLAIDCGYTNWLAPPYHLHVFSEKSLKLVMYNKGLDIIYLNHWLEGNFRVKLAKVLVIIKLLAKKMLAIFRGSLDGTKPGVIANIGLIICRNSKVDS